MTSVLRQPDITYHPNHAQYQARSAKIKAKLPAKPTLPDGFPKEISGDLVWEGKSFTDPGQWTIELDAGQLEEIEAALEYFKGLDRPLGYLSQETFPLPTLSKLLRLQAQELATGKGFFVLRGLPVAKHSMLENIIIYTGLSSHVADTRGRQDTSIHNGARVSNMLNHIKDLSQSEAVAGKIGSPAYTTDKQVFHTDSGDIVSLFCLGEAAEGGESKVASTWRVYNELARTRPDIIRTLAEDWAFDGYGNPDKPAYTSTPLLFHTPATSTSPERISLQYARRSFVGFLHLPRSKNIPPITEAQAEALDALHFLAEKYAITLDFKKGDVQFVNNVGCFHARGGFRDEAGVKERHLLRLWLRDSKLAWETPSPLQDKWDALYKDVTPEEQLFSIEPRVRGGAGKYQTEKGSEK